MSNPYIEAFYESPLFVLVCMLISIVVMRSLVRFGLIRAPADRMAHRRTKARALLVICLLLGMYLVLEGQWGFAALFSGFGLLSWWGQPKPE